METKTILSLFDYSGNWSRPYREAGYNVLQMDIKLGQDILALDPATLPAVHGILCAVPCTDFAVSGTRWWKDKDADGRTAASLALLDKSMAIIEHCRPAWWVLENPVGRINSLRPDMAQYGLWYFQPCWFGDAYTKKTGLWGTFSRDLPRNDVEPVMCTDSTGKRGSWQWAKLGGKSERTKTLRSLTPPGFAEAFFTANP